MKYYDIATEKRAEFEKAMVEYNKKKVYIVHVCPVTCYVLSFLSSSIVLKFIWFPHAGKWRHVRGIRLRLELNIGLFRISDGSP